MHEKASTLEAQPTYNANFHSPSELDISNRRNKAAEYHALLNRLPTLGEVLARKTQSPVDLWLFYLFMKDHEHAIDYLDFWLDVMDHLTLCKHYVRGLRESIIRNLVVHRQHAPPPPPPQGYQQQGYRPLSLSRQHLASAAAGADPSDLAYHLPTVAAFASQPPLQRNSIPLLEQSKHRSLSSSLLLEMIVNDNMLEDTDLHRLLQFLRGDLLLDNNDPRIVELIEEYNREHASEPLPHPQFLQSPRVPSERRPSEGEVGRAHVALVALQPRYVEANTPGNKALINPLLLERLLKETSLAAPLQLSKTSFVTRENLRELLHNLLLKYFVEDAEKKIAIPPSLNAYIVNLIERDGRDDPDVFGGVRDYVFRMMENELFPKFLTTVAIQNITETLSKVRMVAGLVLLFFAFWIAYILLFLDYRKHTRAVCVVPFLVAFYLVVLSIYYIDPILVLCGFSELFHRDTRLVRLRERFVHRLLIKRLLWVLFLVVVFTVVLTLIYSLVPGHRL